MGIGRQFEGMTKIWEMKATVINTQTPPKCSQQELKMRS